jgi:hypothetical protein
MKRVSLGLLLPLLIPLLILFWKSFQYEQVVFSNDGPFGSVSAAQSNPQSIFTGGWGDLNWLGDQFPTPGPAVSVGIRSALQAGWLPWAALAAIAIAACLWGRRECWNGRSRKAVAITCFATAAGIVAGMVFGESGVRELWAQCGGMVFAGSLIATYALRTDV